MPVWSFDETRFREEVFKPLDAGWDPRENLFRCYQLPVDTEDADLIDKALDAVSRHIKRNAIGGPFVAVANTLLEVHKEATRTLRDRTKRAAHRKRVLAEQQALQEALRGELAGARELPPAAVEALVAPRARRFTQREVRAVLAALCCRIREPVDLPTGILPSNWREIRAAVRFLKFPTLGQYLCRHFPAGVDVSKDDLERRRKKVDEVASGDALTAETKILVAVGRWLSKGELRDVLRAEAIDTLSADAALGAGSLRTVLQEPGTRGYLTRLELPEPDELAYALWCRVRYPASGQPNWQVDYQQARAARQLRTAYDLLAAQRSLPPDLVTARNELKAQIAEADRLLAQARELEGRDVEAAAEHYVQAARLCADPEAESGLRRCRPAPPPRALARVDGEQVVVEWEPSAARVGDVTYRVTRQAAGSEGGDLAGRSSPVGNNAVVAAGTSRLTVTDSEAPAGMLVSYQVWTLRNDEPSAQPTRTDPVVVLRTVQDLELQPDEEVVELRWALPPGATGARIRRRSSDRAEDRELTWHHDGNTFRDTTVRTSVRYTYQVEAEYRLPGGELRHAPGVVRSVRPQQPPQPVHDLALQSSDDAILLSWTPPPQGDVQLRILDTAPAVRPDAVLSLAAAQRLGVVVRTLGRSGPGALRVAVPADGRRHWLLPLTVVEDVAVVGRPVEYDSRLPIIPELRAERLGAQVRLTWTWPAQAVAVLVSSKPGQPPTGPDDPDVTAWTLTRARYEQSGCYALMAAGQHWFGVCVAAFTDGAPVFGPMATVRIIAPPQAHYEITRVSRLRPRRRRLTVTSGSGPLPGVRVVARLRLPPLAPSDGQEIARFAAPGTGATSLTGEFDLPAAGRPLHLRAFPAGDDTGGVVLVPANPAQLRID